MAPQLQAVLDYVAPLPFFAAVPPETGLAVLRQCSLVRLPANTLVFQQGDHLDLLYIIISGAVSVHVRTGGSPDRCGARVGFLSTRLKP
jgi:CRP-like cAMP-binding protein